MRGAAVLLGLGLGCAAGGGGESVLSVGLLPMYSLGLKNQRAIFLLKRIG